jgi:phospholipase/carboxylesterase
VAFRSLCVADASRNARLIVVLLHGYSMSPSDLAPFARSLDIDALFHFLEAPMPCAEGGLCWWPAVAEGRGAGPRDLAAARPDGRDAIRAQLHETLQQIVAAQRGDLPLVLGGFSQGAMLSCDYLLQHAAVPVAGAVLLSSSRIAFEEWQPHLSRLRGLPVFVSHGRDDPDLAFDAGVALEAAMRTAGARTQWVPFDGGHEIPLVVWRRLKRFLLSIPQGEGATGQGRTGGGADNGPDQSRR